jgi:uncharacterized protein YndB with AHSA1/START domain
MEEATMATFQNTVTIRRSVQDVFAFLADFENIPKWNYAIVERGRPPMDWLGSGPPTSRSVPSRAGAKRVSR